MSDLTTIIIILASYLCISIAIGFYGRSKEDTAEDYFVASRKINPWVLFCTLAATNFSAFFFLGIRWCKLSRWLGLLRNNGNGNFACWTFYTITWNTNL